MRNHLLALRRRLDYFDLLALAGGRGDGVLI